MAPQEPETAPLCDCGRKVKRGRSGRWQKRCVPCVQERRAFRFKEYLDRLPPERRAAAEQTAEANRQKHREERG